MKRVAERRGRGHKKAFSNLVSIRIHQTSVPKARGEKEKEESHYSSPRRPPFITAANGKKLLEKGTRIIIGGGDILR